MHNTGSRNPTETSSTDLEYAGTTPVQQVRQHGSIYDVSKHNPRPLHPYEFRWANRCLNNDGYLQRVIILLLGT